MKQTTVYGRKYKYDTFIFDDENFDRLIKTGFAYASYGNNVCKQWLRTYNLCDTPFTIVVKNEMDNIDKLKAENKKRNEKEAANEATKTPVAK